MAPPGVSIRSERKGVTVREPGMQRVSRRVVGRPALVRSLRGLLRRAHRFSAQRARTRDDLLWAARFVDGLEAILRDAEGHAATLPRPSTDTSARGLHGAAWLQRDGHDA